MAVALLTAGVVAVVAGVGLMAQDVERAPGPAPTRQPANVPVAQPETAQERMARLWPAIERRVTPMRPPVAEPTIRGQMLRQTRHDGHAGLFTARPDGFRPVAVVLHATGSGMPGSEFPDTASLGAFFQRQGVAASHYGISRDGTIAQYVDERYAAFHVSRPGWNGISIGIELLNDNTGDQAFPPAQLRAARTLVTTLGARYGIPVEGVVPHRAIQPEDRSDPASNFPWDAFVASLGQSGRTTGADRERRLDVGRERLSTGAE